MALRRKRAAKGVSGQMRDGRVWGVVADGGPFAPGQPHHAAVGQALLIELKTVSEACNGCREQKARRCPAHRDRRAVLCAGFLCALHLVARLLAPALYPGVFARRLL